MASDAPATVAAELIRDWLVRLEAALAGASLLGLLALTLTQIVARNFFDTGFPLLDTVARHLVLYVLFFGAALALDARRHIKIDVLALWIPPRWQGRLARPLDLLGTTVCVLLGWAAVRYWQVSWSYAGPDGKWAALMDLIIPVGFILLALHFAVDAALGRQDAEDGH
ncbi:MAG: TRAP transporter small permease [Gammaproteobacteria bacterium]